MSQTTEIIAGALYHTSVYSIFIYIYIYGTGYTSDFFSSSRCTTRPVIRWASDRRNDPWSWSACAFRRSYSIGLSSSFFSCLTSDHIRTSSLQRLSLTIHEIYISVTCGHLSKGKLILSLCVFFFLCRVPIRWTRIGWRELTLGSR